MCRGLRALLGKAGKKTNFHVSETWLFADHSDPKTIEIPPQIFHPANLLVRNKWGIVVIFGSIRQYVAQNPSFE